MSNFVSPTAAPIDSAPAVDSSGELVRGDGTTTRSRARGRWRRWRWPLAVLTVLLIAGAVQLVVQPSTSSTPYAIDNPDVYGTRALAQVLGQQGVDVRSIRAAVELEHRVKSAQNTTVAVIESTPISDDVLAALEGSGANLVLIDPSSTTLDRLSTGLIARDRNTRASLAPLTAQCEDPDAVAAASITSDGRGFVLPEGSGATLCFVHEATAGPGADDVGAPTLAGAYATVTLPDGRRITALDSPSLLTNDVISSEGNAALALRSLGKDPDLLWFMPVPVTDHVESTGGAFSTLPPGSGALALLALAVALMAILWRGHQFGPVVAESLPVEVRASEATLGRGRLYRRAGARGRAAAALRAGSATRLATRLGLPRSAKAPAMTDAVARATQRDPAHVNWLLYGPTPTDDAQLMSLAQMLLELESEVDRT